MNASTPPSSPSSPPPPPLKTLWFAYLLAPILYAGLVLLGLVKGPPQVPGQPVPTILYALLAVAIVVVVASRVVRARFVRDPRQVIMVWALNETPGVLGFMMVFLGGPLTWAIPLMAVSFVLMVLDAPGGLPGSGVTVVAAGLGLTLATAGAVAPARAEVTTFTPGGFTIEQKLTLPGTPERIYDAITGDLSPWWDHTFSKKPHAFFIEPWPGGGFYELFDAQGNGVKHATVLWAERGKRLRFEGPLGLSGSATIFVSTYDLVAKGDSTAITLTASGAGKVEKGWAEGVDGVWHHFLYDGLKVYVEGGKDQGRKPWTAQRSAELFKKNE